MTSLDLGDKFDTTNVTDMSSMFQNCGYTAMTKLDLGEKFNTTNVTNMSNMFNSCGYTAMTSLDLKDLFDTTNVINMGGMFYACGHTSMTVLDLGPAFTRIAYQNDNFAVGCGNAEMTVYTPETIYFDIRTFKLNKSGR